MSVILKSWPLNILISFTTLCYIFHLEVPVVLYNKINSYTSDFKDDSFVHAFLICIYEKMLHVGVILIKCKLSNVWCIRKMSVQEIQNTAFFMLFETFIVTAYNVFLMKSSWAISCVNVKLVFYISETVSASIFRGWCDGCHVCVWTALCRAQKISISAILIH
jgi:hypothetical protein